jgi:hypothetical protein
MAMLRAIDRIHTLNEPFCGSKYSARFQGEGTTPGPNLRLYQHCGMIAGRASRQSGHNGHTERVRFPTFQLPDEVCIGHIAHIPRDKPVEVYTRLISLE